MNKPNIQFLTHASFSITINNHLFLCDPWFSGNVFNHAWGLLAPIDIQSLDLSRLKYIWISHEHPDHLHFPTLKLIQEHTMQPVTVLYRKQKNKNVVQAVTKLGYNVQELPNYKTIDLEPGLSVTSYPSGGDTALIIQANNTTILNQNDCHMPISEAKKIHKRFPIIDAWFYQFSLAGYYGNADDKAALEAGRQDHLHHIEMYYTLFKPKLFIPFASFVYFAKSSNAYLNPYAIHPKELLEKFPSLPIQILKPFDLLEWNTNQQHNSDNCNYWEDTYTEHRIPDPKNTIPESELIAAGTALVNTKNQCAQLLRPGTVYLEVTDNKHRYAKLDFKHHQFELTENAPKNLVAGKLDSEELLFFLKFPFGGDTLNITAAFYVYNPLLWNRLLYYRHGLYIFSSMKIYHTLKQFLGYQIRKLTSKN